MEGPRRLDEDLWRPSALGCIGPGELASLSAGRDVLYRPLLALHRLPLDEPADHEGSVEVVTGEEAWDRLCAEQDVLIHTHGRPSALRTDERVVVVAVRKPFGRGVAAVLAVRPERLEPRVGEVVMAWYPDGPEPDDGDALIARGWLALFGAAAERGMVGLTADVTDVGPRRTRALRRLAGLRPIADDYAAVGLSGPDAAIVVDRWRATVAVDGTVDVRLDRHDDDPAARAELAARLARLMRPGDDDAPPAEEVHVYGPVRLDGCNQWGSDGRADHLLARWAREHR